MEDLLDSEGEKWGEAKEKLDPVLCHSGRGIHMFRIFG